MKRVLPLLSPFLWIFRSFNRFAPRPSGFGRLRMLLGLVLLPILATVGMFIGFAFLWVLALKWFFAKPVPAPKPKNCDEVLEAEYRVLRKSKSPNR